MILECRSIQPHEFVRSPLAQAVCRYHVPYGSSPNAGRSEVFCCVILQGTVVEHGAGQEAVEPHVFSPQGTQPTRMREAVTPPHLALYF